MAETDDSVRIDRSLLGSRPPLSSAAEQYLDAILKKYGPKLIKIILHPNFSYETTTVPPSGLAYVFARDAPMFSEPFHPNKFSTWGVSIYELSSQIPERPLNEAYFTDPARRLLAKMTEALAEEQDGPSLANLDDKSGRDKRDSRWLPVLGGRSGYAEVARCVKKVGNKRIEQWVLVVSTSLPKVSRALLEIVERNEKKVDGGRSETTLTIESMIASPEMRYAENLGRRNRGRAAARIAAALGVNIKLTGDYASFEPEAMIGVPLVENASYHLRRFDDKFIYHAGTTSTMECGQGIVFGQTATLGPVLLHGYPGRGPWSCAAYLNTFPIGTGRAVSDQKLYAAYERDDCSRERNGQKFNWRGDSRHNLRLDNMHNARTAEFLLVEKMLGRMADWGDSELHVVISVLSPSARPAVASKQRV